MQFAKNLNPFSCPVAPGSRRRGFTLIELMAVIAIMAVLAGLIVGGMNVANRKSAEAKVKAQMAMLEIALDQYRQEFGYFPQQAAAVSVTRSDHLDVINDAYRLRTSKTLLDLTQLQFNGNNWVDTWDNPFQYQCPGTHNLQTYDLWSNGADDDLAVTRDDINNWSRN